MEKRLLANLELTVTMPECFDEPNVGGTSRTVRAIGWLDANAGVACEKGLPYVERTIRLAESR